MMCFYDYNVRSVIQYILMCQRALNGTCSDGICQAAKLFVHVCKKWFVLRWGVEPPSSTTEASRREEEDGAPPPHTAFASDLQFHVCCGLRTALPTGCRVRVFLHVRETERRAWMCRPRAWASTWERRRQTVREAASLEEFKQPLCYVTGMEMTSLGQTVPLSLPSVSVSLWL